MQDADFERLAKRPGIAWGNPHGMKMHKGKPVLPGLPGNPFPRKIEPPVPMPAAPVERLPNRLALVKKSLRIGVDVLVLEIGERARNIKGNR